MLTSIAQIAGAISAVCGLIFLVYRLWFNPEAKRRKEAVREGIDAVKQGDTSRLTFVLNRLNRYKKISNGKREKPE
jgi:hypothetical protein